MSSVHSAGILDVPGELLRICCRKTVAAHSKLKVIYSVITWSVQSCATVTQTSCYCALFYVFRVGVRYHLEQRVFIYDAYVKTHTNYAGENFAVHFLTCPSGDTYNFQITEVRTHGISTDRTTLKIIRVLTEEKLDIISHWFENSPR
jgi:hypothetical protein